MKRILYVGWLGFNNVGDELMWLLFRDLCRERLPAKEYDVIPSIPGIDVRNFSAYDTVVLGGGSLLEPGYIDVAYQAAAKGKKLLIWGSGYDRQQKMELDETGKPLGSLAYEGVHRETNGKLAAAVRHATYCGVRGPLSYQFLTDAGAPLDHAIVSGDPGLLLTSPAGRAMPFIKPGSLADIGGALNAAAPVSQARTIGVNWGTAYNRIFGGNEEKVEGELVIALKHLLAEGYAVHVYPVWGPDREACKRLCSKLGGHPRVTYDPTLYHHEDLMEKLSSYAFTINFKLHANFLSAAAGVPFICLGYRFKALDFGLSTGLEKYVLLTDDDRLGEHIVERSELIEQEREVIKERFSSAQAHARTLLERPFAEGLL